MTLSFSDIMRRRISKGKRIHRLVARLQSDSQKTIRLSLVVSLLEFGEFVGAVRLAFFADEGEEVGEEGGHFFLMDDEAGDGELVGVVVDNRRSSKMCANFCGKNWRMCLEQTMSRFLCPTLSELFFLFAYMTYSLLIFPLPNNCLVWCSSRSERATASPQPGAYRPAPAGMTIQPRSRKLAESDHPRQA